MNRSLAPAFRTSIDFKLPKPERVVTRAGYPIIYLPNEQFQVAKIEFVFTAGKIHEPQPGFAQFTVNLLDKGTSSKNAKQIADLLDYYGAHLELVADSDFASVALYCLNQHVEILLPLVIEILTDPIFPEGELNTYRKIFIENLKVNLKRNSYLASIALRKALFNNHPYGKNTEQDDVDKISSVDLSNFFKDKYSLRGVFIVGSISPTAINRIDAYPSKSLSMETVSIPRTDITHQVIEGPGKDQASIRFGKISVNRKHDDFSKVTLLNHVLGGFFGSRLMKNIREEKGLTYGINSSNQHLHNASFLTIAAEVNSQNTKKASDEIVKELNNLELNLSEEELQIAKNHLIGSIQNDTASLFSVGERLKTIELFQLPENHYTNLIDTISRCTVIDLEETGKKQFSPETFASVIVR